jgi:hypothetical protein
MKPFAYAEGFLFPTIQLEEHGDNILSGKCVVLHINLPDNIVQKNPDGKKYKSMY